jgi:hypothetical protein
MALMGAKGIKPVLHLTTGWPDGDPNFVREPYLAYIHNLEVYELIEQFQQRKVSVNLNDYLASADEIENYLGEIVYLPNGMVQADEDKQ